MNRENLKEKARSLRKQGKTYSKITKELGVIIPKSTLSYWCRDVKLPDWYEKKIKKMNLKIAEKGRAIALIVNRAKRERYLKSITDRNKYLAGSLKNKDTAKIAIAMLYLGEGSKTQKGSLIFGNSSPFIISLFLYLLRYCYDIDEKKFRCTLQCRADQNIKGLEKFWSQITKISLSQFYKARVDSRTIGKPSKKLDYKGVCRIDYFSSDVFLDLMSISKIIYKRGPMV